MMENTSGIARKGTDRIRKRSADVTLLGCNALVVGHEVSRGGYRFAIRGLRADAENSCRVVQLEYCGGDEAQRRELGTYAKIEVSIAKSEQWTVFVDSLPEEPQHGPNPESMFPFEADL